MEPLPVCLYAPIDMGGKRDTYWCDGCPGFGLRVTPAGAKSFVYKYMRGRQSRWITIDKYPEWSIRQPSDAHRPQEDRHRQEGRLRDAGRRLGSRRRELLHQALRNASGRRRVLRLPGQRPGRQGYRERPVRRTFATSLRRPRRRVSFALFVPAAGCAARAEFDVQTQPVDQHIGQR